MSNSGSEPELGGEGICRERQAKWKGDAGLPGSQPRAWPPLPPGPALFPPRADFRGWTEPQFSQPSPALPWSE